jgi:alginate biosynthesis protein AlgX
MNKAKSSFYTFFYALCFSLCITGYSSKADATDWMECPALNNPTSYEGKRAIKYLVPGAQDWLFISKKDFMQNFELKEESVASFKNLQQALKKHGTDLVLVVPPQRGLMHPDKINLTHPRARTYDNKKARASYQKMISQLQQAGVDIHNAPDFENITDYGYERDHHWNAAGAKLVADLTADKIKKLPSYKTLKKQEFIIEEGKDINFRGSAFIPVKKICDKELPITVIKENISTLAKSDETNAADLFDSTEAEIVLIGTSFSEQGKSFANFAGHLRVALSADINNQSLGGGGISKSISDFLGSDTFKKTPPKVLIWEIPGFYTLNRANFVNEMTALVSEK